MIGNIMARRESVIEVVDDYKGLRTRSRNNIILLNRVYDSKPTLAGIRAAYKYLLTLLGKSVEVRLVGFPQRDSKNVLAEVGCAGKSVNDEILRMFESTKGYGWWKRRRRTFFGKNKDLSKKTGPF